MSEAVMFYDRLRWEEKELMKAAEKEGFKLKVADTKSLHLNPSQRLNEEFGSLALQRCISHYRGLYLSALLETAGLRVINSFKTTHICGDKLLTSLTLFKAGLPIPRFAVAFTSEAAIKAIEKLGLPVVFKPVVGSHGRFVSMVNDMSLARSLLEHIEALGNGLHRVHYIQEYIDKPSRDIRVVVVGGEVVASIYRYAPDGEWRTNVAVGGRAEPCKLPPEVEELALRAAEAVGGEVVGVDLMESKEEVLVNEVNPTVEFKGASLSTGIDVALKVIKYVKEVAKK
ncbi:MAG: lysine biosynthesis protein LysX [Thermoprotei archaeon]|nr:MAG: lysine biosynthesis protein LysX [Thermoprotei archaeon]RLF18141.1 MAG: lysine biosynthesis protein LysX [Thermoprotei archaeon]